MSGGNVDTPNPSPEGRRTAFTLIELLVVISIIIVLMAFLLPALQKARQQAKAVTCQARLHQWSLMFHQYTSDYDGWFFYPWGPPPNYARENGHWYQVLKPYYRGAAADSQTMLTCPARTFYQGDGWVNDVGYGLNGWVNDASCPLPPNGAKAPDLRLYWRHADKAASPGTVPVLLDFRFFYEGLPRATDPPAVCSEIIGLGWMATFCEPRHGPSINSLFMDWSVRKVGLKELWTLKWHREFETAGPWTLRGGVRAEDWPGWMRSFKDY